MRGRARPSPAEIGRPRAHARTAALALSSLVVLSTLIVAVSGSAATLAGPLTVDPAARAACGGSGADCPSAGLASAGGVTNWSAASALNWAAGSAPTDPAGTGAGLATDALTGTAVLFGGAVAGNLSATTQLYNQSRGAWSVLAPTGAPSPRSDFAFAADPARGEAVLFGGVVNLSSMRVDRSTWLFDFSTGAWTNVTGASGPAARENAAIAVDPSTGMAYLFGGENPTYSPTSSITYNDLWTFNFTSDAWVAQNETGASLPPPLTGASLAWNSVRDDFQMFGGCYPCSSTLWVLAPRTDAWSTIAPSPGATPTGRQEAAFAFDPAQNADVLYGGADGASLLNDTWEYNLTAGAWIKIAPTMSPGHRADAAASWFDVPGNETLLLTGGNASGPRVADLWQLAPTSNVTIALEAAANRTSIAGGFVSLDNWTVQTGTSGTATFVAVDPAETNVSVVALGFAGTNFTFWLPPNSNLDRTLALTAVPNATLSVRVVNATGAPVEGATVVATTLGTVVAVSPPTSSDQGWTNFTGVETALPLSGTNVTVSAVDAYTNWSTIRIAPGSAAEVEIVLVPFPVLQIHVVGELANLTEVSVRNATVADDRTVLGKTSAAGWLNTTSPVARIASLTITADGFVPLQTDVPLPYSGVAPITVFLVGDSFGRLEVTVLDAVTGLPVLADVRATSSVASSSIAASGSAVTNLTGVATLGLPQANYTVSVSSPDYLPQSVGPYVRVLSGQTLNLSFLLTPRPGATVDVRVLDAVGGNAVPAAVVAIPYQLDRESSILGWANFSNVHFGTLAVVVSHAGYITNSTNASFAIGELVDPFLVNLTPIPPAATTTPSPWASLNAGASAVWPFAFLLVVVGGGVGLYLFALRIPRRSAPSGPT